MHFALPVLGTETRQYSWFCLSHHIPYCQKSWIVCLSHHIWKCWDIISTDSHPATGRYCGSPYLVGFSPFYHEPYQPQRINKGGSPFRPPPWAKSLILTVPGLGLSPQRHTYGSESVPIVQGLVYDLNVYKTHGEWLSQWNLTTWDAFKIQWVFSFLPRPTDKYLRVL